MVKNRKKNIRKRNIIQLLLAVIIIILVNIISSFIFTRFDLTAEKRYTLSKATKQILKNIDDVVFFKVYLEGDLPPGFRRLSNETREMLNEFRAYSDNIQYEFVDPSSNPNTKERNDTYRLLAERGLQPTDLRTSKKGQSSQLIIFPGAIVTYAGREVPVQLLMTQLGQDPNKVLNNSIQTLEYNLASAIQKLTMVIKPRIAFIEGQGELSKLETYDLEHTLSEYYNVERVNIDHKVNSLALRLKTDSVHDQLINKFQTIIIAKPTKPFDEKDKFLIDQFIMRGGRVLWIIDPVFASMDSLGKYNSTMGIVNEINLTDQLYNYGIRLNNNLLLDLNALQIVIKTGQVGNQPQLEYFPFYFFPLLVPYQSHPIVNGLNLIKTEFVSSLDTVPVSGVKSTYLLATSHYSRIVNAPVYIDLEILKKEPDPALYSRGPQPVAALLEGVFTSAYLFRIPPELEQNLDLGFRKKSKFTKMIVITDGDIIKNQFEISKGYPLPLGYDQWTRQSFGNKDLMMNIINYLCDDSGLITVRSRELKLRMLDSSKIDSNRIFWQIFNIFLPLILILVFGLIKFRIRKIRFSRGIRQK